MDRDGEAVEPQDPIGDAPRSRPVRAVVIVADGPKRAAVVPAAHITVD